METGDGGGGRGREAGEGFGMDDDGKAVAKPFLVGASGPGLTFEEKFVGQAAADLGEGAGGGGSEVPELHEITGVPGFDHGTDRAGVGEREPGLHDFERPSRGGRVGAGDPGGFPGGEAGGAVIGVEADQFGEGFEGPRSRLVTEASGAFAEAGALFGAGLGRALEEEDSESDLVGIGEGVEALVVGLLEFGLGWGGYGVGIRAVFAFVAGDNEVLDEAQGFGAFMNAGGPRAGEKESMTDQVVEGPGGGGVDAERDLAGDLGFEVGKGDARPAHLGDDIRGRGGVRTVAPGTEEGGHRPHGNGDGGGAGAEPWAWLSEADGESHGAGWRRWLRGWGAGLEAGGAGRSRRGGEGDP